MNLPSLALLDVIDAGKIIYPHQHQKLTDAAIRLRVYKLQKQKGLPLVRFGNKYKISYLALEEWMKNLK